MSSATDGRDRRRYRRYPAAKLKALLKTKKLMRTQWVDVAVADYNSHGMAIFVEQPEKENTQLTLNLELEMDMGTIKVEKIVATVKNRVDHKSYWRLGLAFNEDSVGKNSVVEEKLERIANILEQSSQLNERLKDQMEQR